MSDDWAKEKAEEVSVYLKALGNIHGKDIYYLTKKVEELLIESEKLGMLRAAEIADNLDTDDYTTGDAAYVIRKEAEELGAINDK